MRFFAALVSSLLVAACGGGDASVESSVIAAAKVQPPTTQMPPADPPQDLIVVFNDASIQSEAQALQITEGIPSSHKNVIKLRSIRVAEKKKQVFSAFGADEVTLLKEYSHLPISFFRIHSKNARGKLLANPNVIGIYEDGIVHRAGLAQSLPLIGQPQAVAAGDQGSGTAVAVLDQRVDFRNAAFGLCTSAGVPSGCKVLVAQDAPGMTNDGLGFQDGHGTNVAATVLAVAPASKVISLNVFNGENAKVSDIVSAINWCIANASTYNIVAMNLSLGDSSENSVTSTANAYYSAFANARASGILPVVAAGNDGHINGISMPAAVAGAVSVGAVYDSAYGKISWGAPSFCIDAATAVDKVTCFSNSASILTLLAPGCRDDAGFAAPNYMCGTSQASPQVAGTVAIIRSAFPLETLDATVARLLNGVSVTDIRNGVTKPRLKLPAALGLQTCSYIASPIYVSVPANGTTSNTISVTNGNGCAWTTISNVNWITILSGDSGSGNGNAQYLVSPNGGTSARNGTISIAGQTVTVTQIGGAVSLSSSSNIWLTGNYSYQTAGLSTMTLNVSEIYHSASSGTTGTLRLEVWLTKAPFAWQSGWRVFTDQIAGSSNGTLGPNQSFFNIVNTQPIVNLPGPGSYYSTLILSQFDSNINTCSASDHFCSVAIGGFTGNFFIPDITSPTVPTGLTASTLSPTKVSLSWNASSDDVAVTAYKVYYNGALIGRVATPGATAFGLTPGKNYQFAVSACDAVGNCSAQSNIATAAGGVELVIHLYQALYGKAPSYAQLNAFRNQVGISNGFSWAASMVAPFNGMSDSDFATLVLNNLGITAGSLTISTVVTSVTGAIAYTAIQGALRDYFSVTGVYSRGTVVIQLSEIISNLEGVDVYGTAAATSNLQVAANYAYSSNSASLVPAVVLP